MTLWALVALLGGLGAVARFFIDRLISASWGRSFPFGTVVINIVGSGLAGIVLGVTAYESTSPTFTLLMLTGFLGGFTTASTLSYEVVELLEKRNYMRASFATFGTLILSVGAAALGVALGSM
jgi:CrcB protein